MEGVTSYYCAYLPPDNSKQIVLVSSHSINYGLYLQLGQKYMRNTSYKWVQFSIHISNPIDNTDHLSFAGQVHYNSIMSPRPT